MQRALHRSALFAQMLCTALLVLSGSEARAASTSPHPAASKPSRTAQKPTVHSRHAHSSVNLPVTLQIAKLRYTGLSSLPQRSRSEFHADVRSPAIEAADDAEARCSRATSTSGSDTVMPCLGLYRGGEARSPIRFSFDVALKSIGAPKDIFVGQCPAGSNNASCNSVIGEAKAEQERLADTLNRQRRYPVATLGVAVSF